MVLDIDIFIYNFIFSAEQLFIYRIFYIEKPLYTDAFIFIYFVIF